MNLVVIIFFAGGGGEASIILLCGTGWSVGLEWPMTLMHVIFGILGLKQPIIVIVIVVNHHCGLHPVAKNMYLNHQSFVILKSHVAMLYYNIKGHNVVEVSNIRVLI